MKPFWKSLTLWGIAAVTGSAAFDPDTLSFAIECSGKVIGHITLTQVLGFIGVPAAVIGRLRATKGMTV